MHFEREHFEESIFTVFAVWVSNHQPKVLIINVPKLYPKSGNFVRFSCARYSSDQTIKGFPQTIKRVFPKRKNNLCGFGKRIEAQHRRCLIGLVEGQVCESKRSVLGSPRLDSARGCCQHPAAGTGAAWMIWAPLFDRHRIHLENDHPSVAGC